MSQVKSSMTGAATSTGGERLRRWGPLVAALVVTGWAVVELVGLVWVGHTVGAELYGILVAAVAVIAGLLSIALLASPHRRALASASVVLLWTVIAVGGIAGAVAHAIGPVPGHGPVDERPRPAGAPLVFTGLGLVGGGALVYRSRRRPGEAASHERRTP